MPANTLCPADSVPEKPATGRPARRGRILGLVVASWSVLTRAAGAILSCGDRPLPSTRCRPPGLTPRCFSSSVTAVAAPLYEAGWWFLMATWRARFSAITLLLSWSICCTIADSGGDWVLARVLASCLACCSAGVPVTWIPSA
jgi:hypothetical protein